MADLNDSLANFTVPADPETGVQYHYSSKDSALAPSFSLCATFDLSSSANLQVNSYPIEYAAQPASNWKHGVGNVCFDRTIDPALYPAVSPVK